MTSAKNFFTWVHNMFVEKTFNMSECVNFIGRWLPLSSHFEMHLQKGSVYCISLRVSSWSSVSGWCGFNIFRWCGICRGMCLAAGVGGKTIYSGCNYHVNGSMGGYLSVFDIYQMWETVSCLIAGSWYLFKGDVISGEFQWCLFTSLFPFSPLRNFCRGLWSMHATMSDPCR